LSKPNLVERPVFFQLADLIGALKLCHELSQLSKKQNLFIGPLAVQLRALLIDSDKRSRALLVRLQEYFTDTPILYSPEDFPKFILELGDFLAAQKPVLALESDGDRLQEVALSDLPQKKVIVLHGKYYTLKDLILWRANKFQGAHYPSKVKEQHAALEVRFRSIIDDALVEVGDIVSRYGHHLVRERLIYASAPPVRSSFDVV